MNQRILVTDDAEPRAAAPWWIRAAERFGVPSVIACFLIWALVQLATGDLRRIPAIEAQLTAQSKAMDTHDQDTKHTFEAIKRLLGGICLNGAKTPEQQRRCLD